MAPFKLHHIRPSKSRLNSRLRCYGLTAKDIIEIREMEAQIRASLAVKLALETSPLEDLFQREIAAISDEIQELLRKLYARKAGPPQLQTRYRLILRKYLKIDDLVDEESRVMINFRFINKDQLKQLNDAFRFPNKLAYKPSGNTFTGEEVFLAGLVRIHGPVTQLDDFYYSTMGLTQEQVSMCISCFLDHVIGECLDHRIIFFVARGLLHLEDHLVKHFVIIGETIDRRQVRILLLQSQAVSQSISISFILLLEGLPVDSTVFLEHFVVGHQIVGDRIVLLQVTGSSWHVCPVTVYEANEDLLQGRLFPWNRNRWCGLLHPRRVVDRLRRFSRFLRRDGDGHGLNVGIVLTDDGKHMGVDSILGCRCGSWEVSRVSRLKFRRLLKSPDCAVLLPRHILRF